jgi:hydroxymethylbilane synthase
VNRIRIGTRGSNLALIQARKTKDTLQAAFPDLEISIDVISTKGDRNTTVPLHKVQATGVFVKELEQALVANRIDLAVHSLKDMPSQLPDGLAITAVLERDDPRDALLRPNGEPKVNLTMRETVGTSSLRRKAQLLRMYPGITVVDIRGNIETRLSKLDNGLCDATILASCGMDRAGYAGRIAHRFSESEMLPAACQGIIAVEQRESDTEIADMLEKISHQASMVRALTERAFLRRIEGGCRVPVACHSTLESRLITVSGLVAREDGSAEIRRSATGEAKHSVAIAEQLASTILAEGGKEIMKSYEG